MQEHAGHIVDIPGRRIFDGKVLVEDGLIADIIECGIGSETDAAFIMPGFIDSHVHIESTLLIPENFARVAVHQGAVAAICDPHEIANVLGVPGVEYMVANGKKVRFHFLFGIPSCVPCTTNETNGATITSKDIAKLINRPEFYGLGEMMNFVGMQYGDPEVLAKIKCATDAGKLIDGHGPGITGEKARLMFNNGLSCDHEVDRLDIALERIRIGMKVQIREGSAACNLDELMPLLADDASRGLTMFCTDDKYPDEFYHGCINQLASRCVRAGYDLWRILETACMTPVRHFRTGTGLLQKGDPANFIKVQDLTDFKVLETIIDGYTVFAGSHCTDDLQIDHSAPDLTVPNCFKAAEISEQDLEVPDSGHKIRIMVSTEGSLFTKEKIITPKVTDGLIRSDVGHDVLKIAVLNRYEEKAKPATGFISGFGLKSGALASTIAHDSHNIVCIGTSDHDMVIAINALIRCKGGLCVVKDGQAHVLELPVAGLMSTERPEKVGDRHVELKNIAHEIGCQYAAPFMTMSFMALPPIPELKITDKGLFDVGKFTFTSLYVED